MRHSKVGFLALLLAACLPATWHDAEVPLPSAASLDHLLLISDDPRPGVSAAARAALLRRGFDATVVAGEADLPGALASEHADAVLRLTWPAVSTARPPTVVQVSVTSARGEVLWRGEVRIRRDVVPEEAGRLAADAAAERLQLWMDDWPFGQVKGFSPG